MKTTDTHLIEGLLAGERSATSHIIEWIDQVLNFHGWGERVDHDEVRQETCLAVLCNLRERRFRGHGGGLQSYVQSIARRQCLRALRRSYSYDCVDLTEMDIPDTGPDPEEQVDRKQREERMRVVLRRLDPICRRTLVWKFVRDWSHQKIAERLGISVGAARTRLHRCLKNAMDLARSHEIR